MLCLFELTDEEAGKMFKANYAYADEGIIPEFTGSMMTVFSMYRSQIDRCKEAYRRKCEKNRKNRLNYVTFQISSATEKQLRKENYY